MSAANMTMRMVVVAGFLLFRRGNGNLVPLLVVAAVVLIGLLIYRTYLSQRDRRRTEQIERADIDSLTEKVESLLGDAANKILEVEDRPALIASPEATEHFQEAVSSFGSVDDRLESATTVGQLRSLVSELDAALWRLDAAQAVLDGRAAPARTDTLPAAPRPAPDTTIRDASSEAIARWMDRGTRGRRRRHGRSC